MSPARLTALRFWKGANEGSTHTGHVWTATGQLLATVTFSNESASGWQAAALGDAGLRRGEHGIWS
jgi:hypothetical protein